MSALIEFNNLMIGEEYDRPALAKLWGYKGHQALSRGVVTPLNSNKIILFVTKEKQSSLPQYSDYIVDDFLYWESEEKGGNNKRIINSRNNNDVIHLFYRNKHHQYFKYLGITEFLQVLDDNNLPHQFLFKVTGGQNEPETEVRERTFAISSRNTQSESIIFSRIGQGIFRSNLFDLWDGCAVTEIKIPELLKASHIKPWKFSNDRERLDPYNGLLLSPTYDALFDKGFISFADDGSIILSKAIMKFCNVLNINPSIGLSKIFNSNKEYLKYHRDNVFFK